jgi:hypothetical protein
MAKTRVYELAKEFSLDSKELVTTLKAAGYPVKNYMSTIQDEFLGAIRRFLNTTDSTDIKKLMAERSGELHIRQVVIARRRKKIIQGAATVQIVPLSEQKRVLESAFDVTGSSSAVPGRSEISVEEKPANDKIRGKTFIVDGSNIVRFCTHKQGHISLEGLLSVLLEIRRQEGDFICIFDANTYFELGKKGKKGSEIRYAMLKDLLPDEFIEVPGGKKADDFIFPQAEKSGQLIISNDRFKDYRDKYPWLNKEDECLFKGRVMRGYFEIPDLDLSIPVRKDLSKMTDELINQCKQP